MEFRNTDIEICMVTTKDPHVHFLTPEEIKVELNKVGETDSNWIYIIYLYFKTIKIKLN